MKQGSNGKGRPRGGRNNNQQPKGRGPSRNQTFDSNGPGVRVRGNAHQVVEKYQALARDASASGDRVLMENYLQHAEHYYRIILAQNQNNPVKAQRLDQGNALIGDADDFEDEVNLADPQGRGAQVEHHDQGGGDQDQDQDDQDRDERDRGEARQEARADDGQPQEKKPRRRSRSARARDAGEAERREREGKDEGQGEAPAAASASADGPQSPAELAAAVTEREKKTRARKAEPAEAGAEVHDLAEEAPKKPRRRRARASGEDGDSKEVANG